MFHMMEYAYYHNFPNPPPLTILHLLDHQIALFLKRDLSLSPLRTGSRLKSAKPSWFWGDPVSHNCPTSDRATSAPSYSIDAGE